MRKKIPQKRKGMSLRVRLTLICMSIIILMSVTLTVASMYNANRVIVNPLVTASEGDSAGDVAQSDAEYTAGASYAASPIEGDSAFTPSAYDGEAIIQEEGVAEAAATFGRVSLWIMMAIIIVGGLATYFAVGRALNPLDTLARHMSGVSENALSARLQNQREDEVGTLVQAFNRLMARLEKAFEDQRSFAAAAAHELKTPLAAVKANVDVLEMDEEPSREEYANLVSVTKTQTDRMIHLVDDLFTISMGEANDFTDEVDLPALLSQLVEERRHAIDARSIQVSVHTQCRRSLHCNAVMVRHALSNVLDNAIKYNTENGTIGITAMETDKSFAVTIADSGIGIPEEHHAYIFEAFYRVDKSRSRKMGGAGLGLSIAHNMVERHGGRISLWGNEPRGTVFTIELPKAYRGEEP